MTIETTTPQIKICGITTPDEAGACVELGADAIGCVFYPKSPRYVNLDQARKICRAVAGQVAVVGVFTNDSLEMIAETVTFCGLSHAQLHGAETPAVVASLSRQNIPVIKAFFAGKEPAFAAAGQYQQATAGLVECGGGVLPGGNARTWDWGSARTVGEILPLVLAGGLNPDNISQAIAAARPDVVDVSSGVEASPGKKDMEKVGSFINNTKQSKSDNNLDRPLRRIF